MLLQLQSETHGQILNRTTGSRPEDQRGQREKCEDVCNVVCKYEKHYYTNDQLTSALFVTPPADVVHVIYFNT